MSADEVQQKIGTPAKIRALTAMEGTELQDWFYANGLILHFTNGVLKAASLVE